MIPDFAASPFFVAAAVLAALGLLLIFAGVGALYRARPIRFTLRTIYQLSEERPVDLFGLRRRYEFLSPLLDAEYGSATFVPVSMPVDLELRVSISGLLIREAKAP